MKKLLLGVALSALMCSSAFAAKVGVSMARFDDNFLTVLRNGNRISVPVKLIAAPESRPRDPVKLTSRSPLAGLTVANLSPALAEELSMETANEGVVVSDVEEGSSAANIGFQKGDIIMALNGERMATSRDVEAILRERRRAWEVTISRKGQTITSVFPG